MGGSTLALESSGAQREGVQESAQAWELCRPHGARETWVGPDESTR